MAEMERTRLSVEEFRRLDWFVKGHSFISTVLNGTTIPVDQLIP